MIGKINGESSELYFILILIFVLAIEATDSAALEACNALHIVIVNSWKRNAKSCFSRRGYQLRVVLGPFGDEFGEGLVALTPGGLGVYVLEIVAHLLPALGSNHLGDIPLGADEVGLRLHFGGDLVILPGVY